jgi:hypothetical protein
MKGLIVNVMVAVGLFAGAMVGGLAVTGRLNAEGVANIPVLNALFVMPEEGAGEEGAAHGDENAVEATAHGDGGHAMDANHQDPKSPQVVRRESRSLFNKEEPKSGGHGGGHDGGHGDEAGGDHGGDHGAAGAVSSTPHVQRTTPTEQDPLRAHGTAAESARIGDYEPGAMFRFEGMPSGITPEQLNEAWQRVESITQDLSRQRNALQLREKELKDLADDIARRQAEVGRERVEVETMQLRLDERIEQFRQQVKMIRTDEIAGLKRNAATIASFERSKAAELLKEQWMLESGQDRVLKTLEFMDREAVDEILAEIARVDSQLVRDILEQRLKLSREPQPATPSGR